MPIAKCPLTSIFMNSPIKVIIFDIDGTLVDAYDSIFMAMQGTLKTLGLPEATYADVKCKVGWGLRALIAAFVPEPLVDQAVNIYADKSDEILPQGLKFLPNAKSLIDQLLKKDYILAIASNRPSQFSKMILEHLGVLSHFTEVVCMDNVPRGKPEPDMLLEILKRLSLSVDQALFVGDMTVDVQTGAAAGVKTVAVTTGSSTRVELEALKPYKILDDIGGILGIVEGMKE
ncbi:MAG: HAD superfamily hydrolase (TIGR01509 family) [Candidatus Omnitrophota bacterium]